MSPAAAAWLVFLNLPTTTTAGNVFSLQLEAEDQFNNLDTNYNSTANLVSSNAQAGFPNPVSFQRGVAGSNLFAVLKTAGSQTFTATDTTTSSITGGAIVFVNPGPSLTLLSRLQVPPRAETRPAHHRADRDRPGFLQQHRANIYRHCPFLQHRRRGHIANGYHAQQRQRQLCLQFANGGQPNRQHHRCGEQLDRGDQQRNLGQSRRTPRTLS